MISFLPLTSGLFLGWSLGANDASNCFGTAVQTKIVSFRKATIICSLMVILGAFLQGEHGIKTISSLTSQSIQTAVIVGIAAAMTSTIMTLLKIPASASQAVVGAVLGIGLSKGQFDYSSLIKVIICWVGTPVGAMLFSVIIYKILGWVIEHSRIGILTRDKIIWTGLIIAGVYSSYALGANNVTNTVGMFSGLIDGVTDKHLALFGGFAIASGVLTYSKRVMISVGSGIMPLEGFTALVAVMSMGITVHFFAFVGVPVSTSQGIVGAVIGIGFVRGINALNLRILKNIMFGWIMTPIMALLFATAGYAIVKGLMG